MSRSWTEHHHPQGVLPNTHHSTFCYSHYLCSCSVPAKLFSFPKKDSWRRVAAFQSTSFLFRNWAVIKFPNLGWTAGPWMGHSSNRSSSWFWRLTSISGLNINGKNYGTLWKPMFGTEQLKTWADNYIPSDTILQINLYQLSSLNPFRRLRKLTT